MDIARLTPNKLTLPVDFVRRAARHLGRVQRLIPGADGRPDVEVDLDAGRAASAYAVPAPVPRADVVCPARVPLPYPLIVLK